MRMERDVVITQYGITGKAFMRTYLPFHLGKSCRLSSAFTVGGGIQLGLIHAMFLRLAHCIRKIVDKMMKYSTLISLSS